LISGRDPVRPLRRARPPAKRTSVGAIRQPSPSAVNTAGLANSNGLRSTCPRPLTVIRPGATLARVTNSNALPRCPANAARISPRPLTSLALAVSRDSRIAPLCSPRATTTPLTEVASSASKIVPSIRPFWTRNSGGPAKRTPFAERCASIFWSPPTGLNSKFPIMPPPASVSVPVNPPGSERRLPRAVVPMTSSAAIAIVARPPLGSNIWPLDVNGPSRDPPDAR
jgi:hypothetical protein